MRRRPAAPTAASLVIDALAVYRGTRLLTTDTFPPIANVRERLQHIYPQEGDQLDEDLILQDSELGEEFRREWEGRGVFGERVNVPAVGSNELGWTAEKSSPLGELISCRWCMSVWVAGGAVLVRRRFPRAWRTLASILAGSAVAGLLAGAEA